ncbi:hypothetical protein MRX96_018543 [Rhipicephalus microplus]
METSECPLFADPGTPPGGGRSAAADGHVGGPKERQQRAPFPRPARTVVAATPVTAKGSPAKPRQRPAGTEIKRDPLAPFWEHRLEMARWTPPSQHLSAAG